MRLAVLGIALCLLVAPARLQAGCHHTELGLLGEGGDAAMCATGLAMASTVGLLRILADRHYASDVIMGAAVGLVSGWLVPWLLHYDIGGPGRTEASLAPMIDANQLGAQIYGVF